MTEGKQTELWIADREPRKTFTKNEGTPHGSTRKPNTETQHIKNSYGQRRLADWRQRDRSKRMNTEQTGHKNCYGQTREHSFLPCPRRHRPSYRHHRETTATTHQCARVNDNNEGNNNASAIYRETTTREQEANEKQSPTQTVMTQTPTHKHKHTFGSSSSPCVSC